MCSSWVEQSCEHRSTRCCVNVGFLNYIRESLCRQAYSWNFSFLPITRIPSSGHMCDRSEMHFLKWTNSELAIFRRRRLSVVLVQTTDICEKDNHDGFVTLLRCWEWNGNEKVGSPLVFKLLPKGIWQKQQSTKWCKRMNSCANVQPTPIPQLQRLANYLRMESYVVAVSVTNRCTWEKWQRE